MPNKLISKYDEYNELLSKNLMIIRKAGKWSTQEFSDMVGASRQTIINIENGQKLNKTLYIAIAAVLDNEIEEKQKTDPNNLLCSVVWYIFESKELTDENRDVALAFISGLTKKEVTKMGEKKVNETLKMLLGAATVAATVTISLLSIALTKKK